MTLVLDAPRSSHLVLEPARTGVGTEAVEISFVFHEARSLRHGTTTMPDLIGDLVECYLGHQDSDWDGEGANGIAPAAFAEALQFVQCLPDSVPVPDVVPEPDGGIALEWWSTPYTAFVASFKGKGSLVYAGVFGRGNSLRGTEVFRDSIPSGLLEQVRRVGETRRAGK